MKIFGGGSPCCGGGVLTAEVTKNASGDGDIAATIKVYPLVAASPWLNR